MNTDSYNAVRLPQKKRLGGVRTVSHGYAIFRVQHLLSSLLSGISRSSVVVSVTFSLRRGIRWIMAPVRDVAPILSRSRCDAL